MHRVTSKEDWDQKLSEAKRDGKIVSFLLLSTQAR